MKIYPPNYMTPKESQQMVEDSQRRTVTNVTNDTLVAYVPAYIDSYRKTVEEFFPSLASYVPFYANYPFKTTIIRLGPTMVFMGFRPTETPEVESMDITDFQPPMESISVFDIRSRLKAAFLLCDLSPRLYTKTEAEIVGARNALNDLLEYFWAMLVPNGQAFEELCRQLVIAEGFEWNANANTDPDNGVDAIGTMLLNEPAGFRRTEEWRFQFRFYSQQRLSAKELREAEESLSKKDMPVDILCIVTSEDLTSIGRAIVIDSPKMRVWDRAVLNLLVNKYPMVFRQYFESYPIAVNELSRRFAENQTQMTSVTDKLSEFRDRLQACPTGQANFAKYEKIGIDILAYLFPESLRDPKPQDRTASGTQRRDVIFRNERIGGFWQRIFQRFDADLIVVDFKNNGEPIGADEIYDVAKYPNDALGRFALVVCRKGSNETAADAQSLIYRNRKIAIPVISDNQLLEMIQRKQQGQAPEDVLVDCLDEMLRKF